jgi:hypothetical protein
VAQFRAYCYGCYGNCHATALHQAARDGRADLIPALLAASPGGYHDYAARTAGTRNTPLLLARQANSGQSDEAIRLLVAAGATKDR